MTETMLGHPVGRNSDPDRTVVEPAEAIPLRRCLLATDIEQYGNRTAPDQHEAQCAYASAMARAAADAGFDRTGWLIQPAGDGELVILPPDVDEARLLARLVPAFAARLSDYNRQRLPPHRVRVRMALHHGLVHLDGPLGYPGPGPVAVSRLVSAAQLRNALNARPDADLALIVSGALYEDIVCHRYEGLRPESFQSVRVVEPAKNFAVDAWLQLPQVSWPEHVWRADMPNRSVRVAELPPE